MVLECIPEYIRAKEWAEISLKYGLNFEYNEFFNPDVLEDKARTKEIINIYKSLGRDTKNDTLHGAFLDITVSSRDPLIKNASDLRVRQSLDIAMELGVRGVVFHTNYLTGFKSGTYRKNWTDANIEYWSRKCEEYRELDIYLENMFDESPELLSKVAEGLSDKQNFGVCLDIAHACLSGCDIHEWIKALAGHIKHIHINDNDGLEDLHLQVGSGIIDWTVLKEKALFECDPSVLIEVSGFEKLEGSYDYLKKAGFCSREVLK